MLKLPLAVSTFAQLRNTQCVYVDKTEHIYNMITGFHRYFLSRPRRFGKSLLVSTISEILLGNKDLFNDLWINTSDYQWDKHGVIQLDFSKLAVKTAESMEDHLKSNLLEIANHYTITIASDKQRYTGILLENLARELFKKYGRVAILIDEYDSPILKTLHNEELAIQIRSNIQQFFAIIKSLDAQINFVFITGVSSFAKAGLFSGINNLQIMTLDEQYATICGYTDDEIDHYFKDHITAWSEKKAINYSSLREEIKTWYNGYSFGYDVPKVYNPFSFMNALKRNAFLNFWFESGTPTFLVDILKKEYKTFDPNQLIATADFLGFFDVNAIPVVPLMFQAGYLTIVDQDPHTHAYTLDYPNAEVRVSFQKYLLEIFAHLDFTTASTLPPQLFMAFNKKNIEHVIELLYQLFAHIPYQIHSKEEKFYHSILTITCISAGIKAQAEYSISHGRIDLVLDMPNYLYIIEIKFNKSAKIALEQIKERRYYERFITQNKPIILLGLSFKRKPSNFTVTYAIEEI